MTQPSTIGPYKVIETVEARAFTVTYRAEHPRVGRTVLIRALKPSVSPDSTFAAEVLREAEVLVKLDHEGVIRLHDLVHTADALYLVLEDPKGTPLAEVLRVARLPVDQALGVALATARALGHLHERGVVHGALGSGTVWIAPHGRALFADLSTALSSEETAELGDGRRELGYLAPERIRGEVASMRSDVWSLGVLVQELVSGARPFASDDSRRLAVRIRSEAPAALPDQVPAGIGRLLARCLAKDPEDRCADAREVTAAIERALASLSPLPVPVLVSRALATARLGEALPPPAGLEARERRAARAGPDVKTAAQRLLLVLGLVVLGGATIQAAAQSDDDTAPDGITETSAPAAGSRDRGYVRVVARPWAEVLVDGELVDVTPVGRPIPVTPGKHYVTFRHPNAPDEQRAIKVLAGQTVFLDVSMRVDRGVAGARSDGGADAGGSP